MLKAYAFLYGNLYRSSISLLLGITHIQCFRNRYHDGLIVAAEDLVHMLFIEFLCKETDDRNDHKTGKHGKCAAVNGALKECREGTLKEHIREHQQ